MKWSNAKRNYSIHSWVNPAKVSVYQIQVILYVNFNEINRIANTFPFVYWNLFQELGIVEWPQFNKQFLDNMI